MPAVYVNSSKVRKPFRILFITIALCVLALVLLFTAIFLVQPERYRAYIEQSLIQSARNVGVSLSLNSSELSLSRYSAQNVRIGIPRKFLFFDIDSIDVQPDYWTLLSLSPRAQVTAKLYGGTLAFTGQHILRKGDSFGTLDLNNLALAEHQQLSGFGIRDGTMSVRAQNLIFDQLGLKSGDVAVSLSGVQKPQSSSFALRNFGLPFNLQLPAFSDLNVSMKAVLDRPNVKLSELSISSSLGKLSATGKLILHPNGQLSSWHIDGTVELSSDGSAVLGQYLPLLSNGNLDESAQRFRILLKGTPSLPIARLSRY